MKYTVYTYFRKVNLLLRDRDGSELNIELYRYYSAFKLNSRQYNTIFVY